MSESEARRILIVDDDPAEIALMRAYLAGSRADDIKVVDAPDVDSALHHINSQIFDVVLLDYYLAGQNAIEVLVYIKKHAPGLPTIVVTGSEDAEIAERVLREGATEFLNKNDINPRVLRRSIRHAMIRERAKSANRKS